MHALCIVNPTAAARGQDTVIQTTTHLVGACQGTQGQSKAATLTRTSTILVGCLFLTCRWNGYRGAFCLRVPRLRAATAGGSPRGLVRSSWDASLRAMGRSTASRACLQKSWASYTVEAICCSTRAFLRA